MRHNHSNSGEFLTFCIIIQAFYFDYIDELWDGPRASSSTGGKDFCVRFPKIN